MSEESKMESEESMVPEPCPKGCGFYGSAKTNNLCSQCYEDLQNRDLMAKPLNTTANQFPNCSFTFSSPSFSFSSSSANSSDSCNTRFTFGATNNNSGASNLTNLKNRCDSCNKRVGLTGFTCRCGNVFCGKHRYPEEHECYVDIKAIGREALLKENSVCKGDKLKFRV